MVKITIADWRNHWAFRAWPRECHFCQQREGRSPVLHDLGLTYGLTENLQLDAGVNIGVTRSADDVNPFIGLSVRF